MHNQYKKISVTPQPNTIPYADANGHLSDWLEADPVITALKQQTEFVGTVPSSIITSLETTPAGDIQTALTQAVVDVASRQPLFADEILIEDDQSTWFYNTSDTWVLVDYFNLQSIFTQFVYDTTGRASRNGDEVALQEEGELWLYNGTAWLFFTNTTLKDATKTSKGVVQIGEGLDITKGILSADVGLKITDSSSVLVNNAYADNLVALFHMENTAEFDTISPVTSTGSFDNTLAKFGSYSYQIDAQADHLVYKFDGLLSRAWTIDFWVYVGSLNFSTPSMSLYLYANENDYSNLQLGFTLNNGWLMVYDKDGYLGSSTVKFNATTWAHIAMTYDPITKTVTPYVDGTMGPGLVLKKGLFAPTYYLNFGGVNAHTVNIDELRICDTVKYTSDFNVPTAAYDFEKLKDHKLVAVVSTPDQILVADNLSTTDPTKALSAKQGTILNGLINDKENKVVAGTGITINRTPAIKIVESDTLQLWPLQSNTLTNSVVGGSNFPVSTFESVSAGNMVYLTSDTTAPFDTSVFFDEFTVEGLIAVPSGSDAAIGITSGVYIRFDGINGRIYFSNGDMTRIEYQTPSTSLKSFAITRESGVLHFFYNGILLDNMTDYSGTLYSLGGVDIITNKLGAAYFKVSNTCKYINNYDPDAGLTVISGKPAPTYNFYTDNTGTTVSPIVDTSSADLVLVYKNGVLLQPTQDYTISGTTLTLVSALVSTDKIAVGVY